MASGIMARFTEISKRKRKKKHENPFPLEYLVTISILRSHGMCEICPDARVPAKHLFISRCTLPHEPWHNGISVYLFIIIITYYYYSHLAFQSVPNHPPPPNLPSVICIICIVRGQSTTCMW